MSRATHSRMHDARDAEDKRLLEAGEHRRLLENYVYLVREWAFARLRDREASDEVAQQVFVRLLAELQRGKRYSVPFRVVVWTVVQWISRGYNWAAKPDAELPEEWDLEAPDAFQGWEDDFDVGRLLESLPPGQRRVLELTYLEGLADEQIAARLGMNTNAVYQARHNGHRKLAELLDA